MTPRRFAAAVLAGIVVWVALVLVLVHLAGGPDRIEEDDARWDCTTMGNQRCGDGQGA